MRDLTEVQKAQIENMKTIGYWEDFGNVLVKQLGPHDVLCIAHREGHNPTYHRVKINSTNPRYKRSRRYIILFWTKLYLDEMIKI